MKLNNSLENILNKIEELIKEGNARRIIIRDSEGKKYMEIPLIVGAIGTLAAPVISSIGFLAGIISKFSIEVIKKEDEQANKIFEVKVEE